MLFPIDFTRSSISKTFLGSGILFLIVAFVVGTTAAEEDNFYTPERNKYDEKNESAKVEDDKPQVLLIGDSIMGGYFKGVKRELKDEANVSRHPGNAGDTRNGLKNLDTWLGDTQWDVIHFNWGLHDLCYRHPESKVYGNRDKERGTLAVSLEDYEKNLEELVKRLKETGATLIWATTTTVPEGEAGRFAGDEDKYNKVAARIMKRYEIPTNDLNELTDTFEPTLFSKPADVHYSGAGNGKLSAQVAEAIRKNGLKAKEK